MGFDPVTNNHLRGYTGSVFHASRRVKAVVTRCALVALLVPASISGTLGVSDSVLQGLVTAHAGKVFTLKVNMREPQVGATNAPMLDKDGWHFFNPTGRIVLAEGERIEVTGVYNYSKSGFFLELAREDTAFGGESIQGRPRIRIRIMVESEADKPEDQTAQAAALIDAILRPIDANPTTPNQ